MASSENKRELILTRSPGRLMVSLSLPAIVGMVVIGLYTFVDAIYAGQLIGVDAMGAVSIAYPFTFINSGLAAMIGMGSASVLSRAIGARDQKSIDQVMGNLVVMNLVLSLAVTVVGVAFARPLLALTGAEGAMLDLGECYLRIIFLGSLFVNFAQSSNMIMRGEGELARAMGIMAGGAILNMVLAPVFILALRDQGLGLEGAACATVLSQAVLAGVMLWWFVKREKTARIVRVAAFTSTAIQWFPGIAKRFLAQHPGIDLQLICVDDEDALEEAVWRGDADCGFFVYPIKHDLHAVPLRKDPLLVVLPPDHPLADAPFVPREALAEEPYIRLESGTSSEMETLFRANDVEPNVRFTIDSDYAVMSMVSAGLGFSVLADLILRDAPFPLAVKQPEVETSREIAIALRSLETASTATRAFLDATQAWIAETYEE